MQTAINTIATAATEQANANGNGVQRLATMRFFFTGADWAFAKMARVAWSDFFKIAPNLKWS